MAAIRHREWLDVMDASLAMSKLHARFVRVSALAEKMIGDTGITSHRAIYLYLSISSILISRTLYSTHSNKYSLCTLPAIYKPVKLQTCVLSWQLTAIDELSYISSYLIFSVSFRATNICLLLVSPLLFSDQFA